MNLDLARIAKARDRRAAGKGWSCRCPCHEDKAASCRCS
jgi:hypothetical protein